MITVLIFLFVSITLLGISLFIKSEIDWIKLSRSPLFLAFCVVNTIGGLLLSKFRQEDVKC